MTGNKKGLENLPPCQEGIRLIDGDASLVSLFRKPMEANALISSVSLKVSFILGDIRTSEHSTLSFLGLDAQLNSGCLRLLLYALTMLVFTVVSVYYRSFVQR